MRNQLIRKVSFAKIFGSWIMVAIALAIIAFAFWMWMQDESSPERQDRPADTKTSESS